MSFHISLSTVPAWLSRPGEVTPCLTRENEVHLNKRSWKWLNQFKILNNEILSENEVCYFFLLNSLSPIGGLTNHNILLYSCAFKMTTSGI